MKEQLLAFLQSQKVLILASQGEETWVTNVFYVIDPQFTVYFVSDAETKHSRHIQENPHVAYSVVTYDEDDLTNRKAIQGLGTCAIVEDLDELQRAIALHNKEYPDVKEYVTKDFITSSENTSHVWKVTPTFMKYWDDEVLGEDQVKEFVFT